MLVWCVSVVVTLVVSRATFQPVSLLLTCSTSSCVDELMDEDEKDRAKRYFSVCVCVCERDGGSEREREREMGRGNRGWVRGVESRE